MPDGGAAIRLPPTARTRSMSRLIRSSPCLRRASSSTAHSANPMADSTERPASANPFRRSSSDLPAALCATSSSIHGSIAPYPALPAIATTSAIGSFWPRIVLVLRPNTKEPSAAGIAAPSALRSAAPRPIAADEASQSLRVSSAPTVHRPRSKGLPSARPPDADEAPIVVDAAPEVHRVPRSLGFTAPRATPCRSRGSRPGSNARRSRPTCPRVPVPIAGRRRSRRGRPRSRPGRARSSAACRPRGLRGDGQVAPDPRDHPPLRRKGAQDGLEVEVAVRDVERDQAAGARRDT